LREFLQWNADILGLDIPPEKGYAEDAESRAEVAEAKARMDAEVIACCAAFLRGIGYVNAPNAQVGGLSSPRQPPSDIEIRISSRECFEHWLSFIGVPDHAVSHVYWLVDSRDKLERAAFLAEADRRGVPREIALVVLAEGGQRTSMDA